MLESVLEFSGLPFILDSGLSADPIQHSCPMNLCIIDMTGNICFMYDERNKEIIQLRIIRYRCTQYTWVKVVNK